MANSQTMLIAEGSSMNTPPAFSGNDYPYWADRMEMYIKSTKYRLWKIITEGDIPLTKPESEWGNEEYTIAELNNKARYAITCALSRTEYNRFCAYKTAKELWDALKISYEGTEDVRLRKAATLQREYEMFSMERGESIDRMFGRFQTILNGLAALEITFSRAQNNMKILDSLPAPWEAMSTAISVGRNMKTLTLDELIGALRVHEVHLCKRGKLKIQELIALSNIDELDGESEDLEDPSEEEISLMARKFKRLMKKRDPKKIRRKKKQVTWDDLDDESSEESSEEKNANICLMARDILSSEVNLLNISSSSSSSSDSDSDYEDISYDVLLANSHFIAQEYINCKSKLKKALEEIENLKAINVQLSEKNISDESSSSSDTEKSHLLLRLENLKEENELLKKDLNKFTLSSSKLKNTLNYGRSPLNKSELGYNHMTDERKLPVHSSVHRSIHDFYNRFPKQSEGHSRTFDRRNLTTNKVGPKKIWVPKSKIIFVADRKRESLKMIQSGQWIHATCDHQHVLVPKQ